jgi:hypothetical protein
VAIKSHVSDLPARFLPIGIPELALENLPGILAWKLASEFDAARQLVARLRTMRASSSCLDLIVSWHPEHAFMRLSGA